MICNFKGILGLDIAGNTVGHLEQAGEIDDFVQIKSKKMFQNYVLYSDGFLSTFCLLTALLGVNIYK